MKKNVYKISSNVADACYILFARLQIFFLRKDKALYLLAILVLNFTTTHAQGPLSNGDFETWITTGTNETPDKWQTTGKAAKTTDKYSGTYAIKMVTQDNGAGLERAWLYGSTVNLTTNVDTLVGYFKYTPVGGDQAYVEISFWDHKGSGASESKGFLLNPAATYFVFSIPLTNSINASDINFRISSSYNNPVSGSTLILDKLQLKQGKPTSIVNAEQKAALTIYPNPANDFVHISLPNGINTETSITVLNSIGQTVWNNKLIDDNIDVSEWSNGIYNFTVVNGNDIYHSRVEVTH